MLSVSIADTALVNGVQDSVGRWQGDDSTMAVDVADAEPGSNVLRLEIDLDGDSVADAVLDQSESETQFIFDPRYYNQGLTGATTVGVRALVVSAEDQTVLDESGWESFEFDILVNQAPTAANQYFQTERDGLLSGDGLLNDASDPDCDAMSVVGEAKTTLQGGWVSINSDGTFEYTPPCGYSGEDFFEFTVDDGRGGQAAAMASVQVVGIPTILSFELDTANSSESYWTFIGTAIGDAIDGATVTFGGVLEGLTAIVGEDGTFSVVTTFYETTVSEATAMMENVNGYASNQLSCYVEIYM
jgi:hypothetical protein